MELENTSQVEKLSQYTQDVLRWAESNHGNEALDRCAKSREYFAQMVTEYSNELIKFVQFYKANHSPLKRTVVSAIIDMSIAARVEKPLQL